MNRTDYIVMRWVTTHLVLRSIEQILSPDSFTRTAFCHVENISDTLKNQAFPRNNGGIYLGLRTVVLVPGQSPN